MFDTSRDRVQYVVAIDLRRPILSFIRWQSAKKEGDTASRWLRGDGMPARGMRWDRAEGTLRRFRTPSTSLLILPTSTCLCRRVLLRLPALCAAFLPFPPPPPPIDRETRNGDSLNLDPVLMEYSLDNGFGMLWRLDVSPVQSILI